MANCCQNAFMATLTIRNLPDVLHEVLRLREILEIDTLRARSKGFLTAEDIDQAKRAGRA